MKRQSIAVAVVVIVLACALLGPWAVREGRHYLHYQALDREGKFKSEFVSLTTTSAPDGTLTLAASVRNSGTQSWTQGEQYFALGVFERVGTRRVENVKFSDGTNRVIAHKDIAPGEIWQLTAAIKAEGARTLHFQMVQEGVTWFGQEKNVSAREQTAGP